MGDGTVDDGADDGADDAGASADAAEDPAASSSCTRLLTKKSGNIFRVGISPDFVWLTTRTMHPRGAYVRRAKRKTETN